MEPLIISTACVGLISAIAKLSVQIADFVSGVRDARRDMDAVSRELASLSLCLASLRDDSDRIKYPPLINENILAILEECDNVTKDMNLLLHKLSSNSLGERIQWTVSNRNDMNRFKSSLKAHKFALDIALNMTALVLRSTLKEDTEDIKSEAAAIKRDSMQTETVKQDASNILEEINCLRQQIVEVDQQDSQRGALLAKFLDASSNYAESVADTSAVHFDREQFVLSWLEFSGARPSTIAQSSSILSFEHRSMDVNDHSEIRTPKDPKFTVGFQVDHTDEKNTNSHREDANMYGTKSASERIDQERSPDSQNYTEPVVDVAEPQLSRTPPDTAAVASTHMQSTVAGTGNSAMRDHRAIAAAAEARSRLSTEAKARCDGQLEQLLRGRKALIDRMNPINSWYTDKVGTVQEIRNVLDAGADILFDKKRPIAALSIELAHARRLEVVELLLLRGALDQKQEGLVYAISKGLAELSELLLKYGVFPDGWNQRGETALIVAVRKNRHDLVQLLLDKGADVNAQGGILQGGAYGTALNTACAEGRADIVKTLLSRGADVSKRAGTRGFTPLEENSTMLSALSGDKRGRIKHVEIEKLLHEYVGLPQSSRGALEAKT